MGPLELLIIQGSPFCNIDCKYCYLEDRLNKKRISLTTISKTMDRILESNLITNKGLHIVWHAGEPLAIPVHYYEEVFSLINSKLLGSIKVFHNFQTNAMLINQSWCDFIKKYEIKVGVSIDGPKDLHDSSRVDRKGNGTFDKTLEGIRKLQLNNIPFHVIAVITKPALSKARDFYTFFKDLGITRLGLNIEENEGSFNNSTLSGDGTTKIEVTSFMEKLFKYHKLEKGDFIIREFQTAASKIAYIPSGYFNSISPKGQTTNPLAIISIDIDGNFSTFSPELLGQKSLVYGDFIFGNVFNDRFDDIGKSDKFKQVYSDIIDGIKKCQNTCQYFSFCGGGPPSNKYYENGSFNSTETFNCKYHIQVPFDIVLMDIEKNYNLVEN